jgi:hypothetical protein
MQPSEDDVEVPSVDLIREAVGDARDLVRIELGLAREELIRNVEGFKATGILALVAVMGLLAALDLLLVVLGVALGAVWTLVVAASVLFVAAVIATVAALRAPRRPLKHTLERLRADEHAVRARLS